MAEFISGEVEKTTSEKFKKLFQRLKSKKGITYLATFLLLVALPLTIYVSLQKQIFQQRAAGSFTIITIAGTVLDASNNNNPLPGVTIWDGLSATTQQDDNKNITDSEGKFFLKITLEYDDKGNLKENGIQGPDGSTPGIYYLVAFKRGYQGQEIKQIATPDNTNIVITTPIILTLSEKPGSFVQTRGTQFWEGNHPFYFVGAQDNSYSGEWIQRHRGNWGSYGGNSTYYSQDVSVDERRMQDALSLGITVDRHGMNTPEREGFTYSSDKEAPIMIGHAVQERGLMTVDRIVWLAHKYNRKVILTLMNNTDTDKLEDIAGAPRGTWATDPKAIQFFHEYVRNVLNHVNLLTGITLKNDPTILAWDLCNEAYFSGGSEFQWYEKQAAFVKTLTRQLVTTGKDGDYARYLHSPSIDFATWHNYPMDTNNKEGTDGTINSGWGIYYDYPYYKGNNDKDSAGNRIDNKPNQNVDGPVTQNFYQWAVQQAINDAQVAGKPLVIEEVGIMKYVEDPTAKIFGQDINNITRDLGNGSPELRASWINTVFTATHQKPTMRSGGNAIDRPGFAEWGKWKRSDQSPQSAGAPMSTPTFTESNFAIDTTVAYAYSTSARITGNGGYNSLFQDMQVAIPHTRFWWSAAGKTDMGSDIQAQVYGWDGSSWHIIDSTNGISSQRLFTENAWSEKGGFIDSGTYTYLRAVVTSNGKSGGNAWFDKVQLIPYVSATGKEPPSIGGVMWWSFNYYDPFAVEDQYSINKSMPLYTAELYKASQWAQSFNPPTPTPTVTPTTIPTMTISPTPTIAVSPTSELTPTPSVSPIPTIRPAM